MSGGDSSRCSDGRVRQGSPGKGTPRATVAIAATLTHITKVQLHPTICDGSGLLRYLGEDNLA